MPRDWFCSVCGHLHSEHRSAALTRLAEIETEIAATKQWGSLLAALNEERNAILKNLGTADAPDTCRGE